MSGVESICAEEIRRANKLRIHILFYLRGEVVVLNISAGFTITFSHWHCYFSSSITAQLILQQSSSACLHLARLGFLLIVDHLEGKGGILIEICFEVYVKCSYSIGFDNIMEIWLLIQPRFIHEFLLDELVVIKGIGKVGFCPVAFFDGDIEEALNVDID